MPQKLEIEDFSGGVTDYYLNAPPNKMRYCDNLLLIRYPGLAKPFTRPGSELYSDDAPQIPAGSQRISTAFIYKSNFFTQSAKKLYWFNSAGPTWDTVAGPTGNDAFNGSDTAKIFTYSHWNFHTLIAHSGQWYPQKVIKNAAGTPEIMEAGLPQIDSSGITFSNVGPNNWLYKFVYKQTYTTFDNITFTDYGAPSAPRLFAGSSPVQIQNIPVLANGATDNFRTTTILVEIYRTINNGTTYYLVGNVTNGTTTFNDNVSDATLQTNATLYTTGGTVAFDRPPKCKLVHIFGDTGYFANIKDASNQVLGYRVQQSTPGDIDSAPASFFLDVDDEIAGMSSTKSNLVLLCSNSVYRVDGFFDAVGRGGMRGEKISDTATCISAQSVVQTLDGVFWCGFDGVYFTDGYKVLKLNEDFDITYKEFVTSDLVSPTSATKQSRIQGKYDKHKNRIWWTIQHESTDDVDKCYILDLNWGIKPRACFYTASGLSSFSPTAIEFDGPDLIRCDRRGYVLKHSDDLFSDIKIDTGASPADWVQQTIFYTLESVAFNFGTSFLRKYSTSISVTCVSTTNLSLQIISNNDDDRSLANLKPIRYRNNVVWGDPDVYWGDPGIEWNRAGLIHDKRRMPAGNLRFNYKSIRFQNAYVVLFTSDIIGTADINASLKTVTLNNVGTAWPTNSVDWYISFEVDGFVKEYLILSRTDTTLVYSDSLNTSGTASAQEWTLRGYPKDEIMNLINYSVSFDVFSPTQGVFNNSDSGEIS